MPCRFASSGTVATSRSASRAILALNVASNFLRDLVISVLHRLRQSRTLHTLTFGPISGVHFMTAPFMLDGAMDGPHFLAYVEQILAPTLKKGDIVFMDNVSTHLVDGVEEAIVARGASVFYLPPYSPDFNPIEQLFAKLKSFLRKVKARTVEQLWKTIVSFLETVSRGECKAYLANSGYA